MAKARNDILWRFLADTKSLEKGNKRAQSGMKKTKKSTAGLTKAAGALGVAFGAGQVVKALGSAVNRAEEMNSVYAVTEQIIQQTGSAANLTAGEVKNLASEMAQTTGIDKAVATEAANVLLSFKELKSGVDGTNGVFERAHALTADVATVMGGAATDAAKQLGKALNDPIAGLGGLSRAGVQFTDDQKAMIAGLVESGDLVGAQTIILEELEAQVGGTAAASADATELMKRGFDEVTEALGQELLPIIEKITPAMVDMATGAARSIGDVGDAMQVWGVQIEDLAEVLTLGLATGADDAEHAMAELNKTSNAAQDLMKSGRRSAQVFAEWTAHLGRESAITAETIEGMADALDLSDEALRKGIIAATNNATQLGLTAEQVVILRMALSGLNTVIPETDGDLWNLEEAALAAADGVEDVGDELTELERIVKNLDFGEITLFDIGGSIAQTQAQIDAARRQAAARAGGVGGVQEFTGHTGGVVPGPTGSVQPAMLKAGERVTSRNHGGGGDINITIEAGIGDPVAIAEQVRDLLNLYDRTNGSF